MKRFKKALLMPWAWGVGALAYTNKVKALAPIAYWPMAEAAGAANALDASGNGYDAPYTNATLGATGIGDGRTAASFAGTGYAALPAGFQAAFNRSEGTAALWVQISAIAWADGAVRAAFRVNTDGSNRVYLLKNNTANQLALRYDAGVASKVVTISGVVATTFIHIALTWSVSGDKVIGYLNGVQQGATLTGLGVWAGAISEGKIAASDTGPNNPFSGQIAHCAVWTTPLSAAQILSLATVP